MRKKVRRTPRTARAIALATLPNLAPVAGAQSELDDLGPERRYDTDVVAAIEKTEVHRAGARARLDAASTDADRSGYDARKYTIHLEPSFTSRVIEDRTRVDAVATAAEFRELVRRDDRAQQEDREGPAQRQFPCSTNAAQ
jgi:hypothetical protein